MTRAELHNRIREHIKEYNRPYRNRRRGFQRAISAEELAGLILRDIERVVDCVYDETIEVTTA